MSYATPEQAFEREVAEHQMHVIRDDGLHRHLRFKRPETGMYHFDLITWPGHLLINGDLSDSLVFSRIDDMFEFFASEHGYRINPDYWAEKLRIPGRGRAVQTYSEPLYIARARQWIEETSDDLPESAARAFAERAREALLDSEITPHEETAREALDHFTFSYPGGTVRVREPWEWNLRDWDFRYLVACHAIVWGVEQYRSAKANAES